MMTSMEAYVRRGRRTLVQLAAQPRVQQGVMLGLWAAGGFFLSAAALANYAMPLSLALSCIAPNFSGLAAALGGMAGYGLFWGRAGVQCLAALLPGWAIAALLQRLSATRQMPQLRILLPAVVTAFTGLIFQSFYAQQVPIGIYFLRVVVSSGAALAFARARESPLARWSTQALGVLALAQVAPASWLCLGFVAGGILAAAATFPAAALAGLALDLAKVTPVPMTAVFCLCYFGRLLPRSSKLLWCGLPGTVYAVVMGLSGVWDLQPVLPLVLGGALGYLYPGEKTPAHRRGETGVVQVHLEYMAGVMSQTQQLLLDTPAVPVDEAAVLQRGVSLACGSCPCNKTCRERDAQLSTRLLHIPLTEETALPIACRKPGRLLAELRRSQEQLRMIYDGRKLQQEWRQALVQQYGFLAQYLREQSDGLGRRLWQPRLRYQPRVQVFANRPRGENGDRCCHFAGAAGKYYVLLCDGMGTGIGAADEADTALSMVQKLIMAGLPAEYALRSLNSICALRGRAGAVSVDLAEVELASGKVTLYKWGAAPSVLLSKMGAEQVGQVGPPPGIALEEREITERVLMRKGEALLLCSDGVQAQKFAALPTMEPAAFAQQLLSRACSGDDATIVMLTLE